MLQCVDFWWIDEVQQTGRMGYNLYWQQMCTERLEPLSSTQVMMCVCHGCMVFIMKKSSNLCASHSLHLRKKKLFCFNFNLSSMKVSSLSVSGLVLHFKFIHSLTPCILGDLNLTQLEQMKVIMKLLTLLKPFFRYHIFLMKPHQSGFSSTKNTQHSIRIITIKAKYWSLYLAEAIICHLETVPYHSQTSIAEIENRIL